MWARYVWGVNNGDDNVNADTQQTLIANWTPILGAPLFALGQVVAVSTNELRDRTDYVSVSAIGPHDHGGWSYEVTISGHRSRLFCDERGWRLRTGSSSQPASVS